MAVTDLEVPPQPKIVRTPDGKLHRFPGQATPEQIGRALTVRYRPPAAPAPVQAPTPPMGPPAPYSGAPDLPLESPVPRTVRRAAELAKAGFIEGIVPSAAGLAEGSMREVRRGIEAVGAVGRAARARGFEAPQLPTEPPPAPPPRNLTPEIAPPSGVGEEIFHGLGGATAYFLQAAALTPLVGPQAALVIPSLTGAGTVEQRAIRGISMLAGGPVLTRAAALTSRAPVAVKAAAGVAAPALVYGSAVPFADVAGQKLIGVEGVEWPTAGDLVPSVATLALFGGFLHAAGLAGKPPPPQVRGLTSEKAAAFIAISEHLKEPPFRLGTTPETAKRLREVSREASDDLTKSLRDKDLVLQIEGQKVAVRVALARVYPYPGEPSKVRLVVEDAATGKRFPMSFRNVVEFRKAVVTVLGAQGHAVAPGPPQPRTKAETRGQPGEPVGAPPPSPERARSGLLRLTQPGVPEELLKHYQVGQDLHPVAADAWTRSLSELSGVVKSSEIRRLARSSKDPETFRARLRDLVRERLPEAVPVKKAVEGVVAPPPEAAPEPGPAERGVVGVIPEGLREGAAVERAPSAPGVPVRERVPITEIRPGVKIVGEPVKGVSKGVGAIESLQRALAIAQAARERAQPPGGIERRARPRSLADNFATGMRNEWRKETPETRKAIETGLEKLNQPGNPMQEPAQAAIRLIELEKAPKEPTHREITMDQVDEVLRDPAHRRDFERMAARGASDDELHGFLRRALGTRGIVLAEEEAVAVPEPAAPARQVTRPGPRAYQRGERVSVPYTGRSKLLTTEKGRVEGYTEVGGEPHVVVVVHHGRRAETRTFPESDVRRLPRRLRAAERHPNLRAVIEQRAGGDVDRALDLVDRAQAARDRLEVVAKQTYARPEMREEHASNMRRLARASDVLEITKSVYYRLGGARYEPVPFHEYESRFEEGPPAEKPAPEAARSIRGLADLIRGRIGIPRPEEVEGGEPKAPEGPVVPPRPVGGAGAGPGGGGPGRGGVERRGPGGGRAPGPEVPAGTPAPPQPREEPPAEAPAGGWRPDIIEARAEHSSPVDERIVPQEFHDRMKPHQRQGAAKMIASLVDHGGGLLASGTGAGKTRQELVVAEKMRRLGHSVLIVTPSQVIKQDWKTRSYTGSFAKDADALGVEIRLWNEKYGEHLESDRIYLTTLEQVHHIKPDPNLVLILDESHSFKNVSAKRTQKMLKLVDTAHSVLAASATPKDTIGNFHYLKRSGILEGGTFAEMLQKIGLSLKRSNIAHPLEDGEKIEVGDRVRLDPKPGLAFPRFRIEGIVTAVEVTQRGEVYTVERETKGGLKRVYRLDREMGQFYRFDIGDRIVPQKGVTAEEVHRRTEALFDRMVVAGRMVRHEISLNGVPIDLVTLRTPPEIADMMTALENEMTEGAGAENLPMLRKAVVKMALRRQLEHLKVEKVVEATKREVERGGQQVVIFADRVNESIPNKFVKVWDGQQYVTQKVPLDEFKTPGTMPLLKKQLEAAGLTVGEIHGGVSQSAQLEAMEKFQAGELDVVVSTPGSGGVGIDLDHSNPKARPRTLIMMTSPFDAMKYSQAIGRVVRSQSISRPTVSVFYFDHPIDEWNRNIIAGKMRDLGATVKGEVPVLIRGQPGIVPPPSFEARMPTLARPRPVAPLRRPSEVIPIPRVAPKLPTEQEAVALPESTVPVTKPHAGRGVVARAKEALHDLVAWTNPVSFARPQDVKLVMEMKGDVERAAWATQRTQEKVRSFWDKRTKGQVMDFLDRLERGRQPDPKLEELAESYRERSNNLFSAIKQYKDVAFWPNWFPHLWKNPEADVNQVLSPRRPLEGSKSFLRKRFYQDIRAGLEAGLELATYNPEEMMQAAEHNVRKFVAVQQLVRKGTEIGSIVEGGLRDRPGHGKIPADFARLEGRWATIYLNPNVKVKEYFDKAIWEGLKETAKGLGITLERRVGIGGKRLGYSVSSPGRVGKIVTRFASPEQILAHEIGHQIDSKYDLNTIIKAHAREIRALADLRWEGQTPSQGFKRYVRSRPEKAAVMIEALAHVPDRFQREMPGLYRSLVKFIETHSDLAPLLKLRPSLTYTEATGEVSAGGLVIGGQYWAQKDLARVLNNHMSADWIQDSQLGRSVMGSRNFINAMELGASGFHATGMTLLSVMSRASLGLSELVRGAGKLAVPGERVEGLFGIGRGAKAIFTAPAAPIDYIREGWKFYQADGSMPQLERDVFVGGARMRRLAYYQNQAFDNFLKNARAFAGSTAYARAKAATLTAAEKAELRRGGIKSLAKAAGYAPFAMVESPMRFLTSFVIPQMKVGAFRELMAEQLRRQAPAIDSGKITREQIARTMWNNIENRMGLLNYDNLFWNRGLRSAVMVMIRAPGWTLGTLREFGGATFLDLPRFATGALRGKTPDFTPRMAFAFSMMLTTLLVNGVYHYLHTGQNPETQEDWLHPKNGALDSSGRPIRIDMPTYWKDVYNWFTRPVRTAIGEPAGHGGKLAGEFTMFWDMVTNQTTRGPLHRDIDKLEDVVPALGEVVQYLFGRLTPFSVQTYKELAKGQATPEEKAEAFFGVTRHRERRPRRPRRVRRRAS